MEAGRSKVVMAAFPGRISSEEEEDAARLCVAASSLAAIEQ